MSLPSINEMGSSRAPTFKFEEVGAEIKGTIVSHDTMQMTEFGTTTPAFWPDGKPKLQVVFVLQTESRDPAIEGDDGQRRVFANGRMLRAVLEARDEAGARTIDPGDNLAIRFTGYGTASTKGFQPPKLYKSWLKKGTPPKAIDLNSEDSPF